MFDVFIFLNKEHTYESEFVFVFWVKAPLSK